MGLEFSIRFSFLDKLSPEAAAKSCCSIGRARIGGIEIQRERGDCILKVRARAVENIRALPWTEKSIVYRRQSQN